MKAYDPNATTANPAGDELRVAVTFKRPGQLEGPTKFAARMSTDAVSAFRPDPLEADLAIAELSKRGFELTTRGELTASMRCSRSQFEALFKTKLEPMVVPGGSAAQFGSVLFPPPDAPWDPNPALMALLDDVYIQWPHIYMAKSAQKAPKKPGKRGAGTTLAGLPSSMPPPLNYFHLRAPVDIASKLNASGAHQMGITGKGIRVAMIDSGFAHSHPFFAANGYSSSVVLAPGAADRQIDGNGHGTGESANIFSVAPGVTFIGVKLDNEANPNSGASILEGLQEALKHDPHIISVSLGYDLRAAGNKPMTALPNNLVALEVEIQAAVRAGKIIVFSAGNGHYSFPGQMAEVLSAGGVFVDGAGAMRASDYASAFKSGIYSGRSVPDVCGLVGLLPHANYLALPIPSGCELDTDCSTYDGTTASDGWGVFSGTSAAAPQLAGVCALLLQADPNLTPGDVKAILRRTARDVTTGNANPASDSKGKGVLAGVGEDGATGAGLVDALAAVQQAM